MINSVDFLNCSHTCIWVFGGSVHTAKGLHTYILYTGRKTVYKHGLNKNTAILFVWSCTWKERLAWYRLYTWETAAFFMIMAAFSQQLKTWRWQPYTIFLYTVVYSHTEKIVSVDWTFINQLWFRLPVFKTIMPATYLIQGRNLLSFSVLQFHRMNKNIEKHSVFFVVKKVETIKYSFSMHINSNI